LIVCIYVDDIIYTGNMEIDVFRSAMEKEFEMTNLGQMKYFLGLEIEQLKEGIFVCQQRYAHNVLTRFKMSNCKPAVTPIVPGTKLSKDDPSPTVNSTLYKQLVGSLMYLTSTRPDIMLSVSIISRFMETPTEAHWKAGKRILRYVAGTLQHGIYYSNSHGSQLIGYSDSDYAGSIDDRKSTTGYAFHIGTGLISWGSRKQSIISLSSAEAEYVAATSAACHAIWLRRLLADLGHKEEGPTPILCDNTSAIALSKNSVFHRKSKHIDTRYHFIRELVNNGEVVLQFCNSKDQLADIFTKPLAKTNFEFQRHRLGIVSNVNCKEDEVEIKEECQKE
jgi:hypothetical protein